MTNDGMTLTEVMLAILVLLAAAMTMLTAFTATTLSGYTLQRQASLDTLLAELSRRVASIDTAVTPTGTAPLTWNYGAITFTDLTGVNNYRASVTLTRALTSFGQPLNEYRINACTRRQGRETCAFSHTFAPPVTP